MCLFLEIKKICMKSLESDQSTTMVLMLSEVSIHYVHLFNKVGGDLSLKN